MQSRFNLFQRLGDCNYAAKLQSVMREGLFKKGILMSLYS